ncbi:MAG TPA: hypothetical protein PLY93_13620, partial [Turneriella sp.]|nr:hypothetical protein [Turneriella sp.]
MFGAGCDGFAFGPVLSNDNNGPVYGVSAGYTYFLIDRLGASLNASAIFGSDYQQYGVGPAFTYFVGP